MKGKNGGYMMLLLLVIGLVLIITFIVRTDFFGGEGNVIERGQDAIDEANKVKTNLEQNYRFDPEAIERNIDNLD